MRSKRFWRFDLLGFYYLKLKIKKRRCICLGNEILEKREERVFVQPIGFIPRKNYTNSIKSLHDRYNAGTLTGLDLTEYLERKSMIVNQNKPEELRKIIGGF